jgi:hypothetical protein
LIRYALNEELRGTLSGRGVLPLFNLLIL